MGGVTTADVLESPPPLSLPHKGGGNCAFARVWHHDVFMMKGLPPPGPLLIHTLLDCR